jgi:16S rRNA processing protein RimM
VSDPAAGSTVGSPEHLIVGHISKPHGTRGELFVWPLSDRPGTLFDAGESLLIGDADGTIPASFETIAIERSRPFKRGFLVKLEGRDDRSAVEPLAGQYIWAPVSGLSPLEEGEVFYHELLGAEVVTREGEAVGVVREVFETEPAHLLEVRGADGKTRLIPFSERIVRDVDVAARRIVVDPPPGLLDL